MKNKSIKWLNWFEFCIRIQGSDLGSTLGATLGAVIGSRQGRSASRAAIIQGLIFFSYQPNLAVPPLLLTVAFVGLRPTHLKRSPILKPSTSPSRPSQKSKRSNTSFTSETTNQNSQCKTCNDNTQFPLHVSGTRTPPDCWRTSSPWHSKASHVTRPVMWQTQIGRTLGCWLVFGPLKKSYMDIQADWSRTQAGVITNLI